MQAVIWQVFIVSYICFVFVVCVDCACRSWETLLRKPSLCTDDIQTVWALDEICITAIKQSPGFGTVPLIINYREIRNLSISWPFQSGHFSDLFFPYQTSTINSELACNLINIKNIVHQLMLDCVTFHFQERQHFVLSVWIRHLWISPRSIGLNKLTLEYILAA